MGMKAERAMLKRMYPDLRFAREVNEMSDTQVAAMMKLQYQANMTGLRSLNANRTANPNGPQGTYRKGR